MKTDCEYSKDGKCLLARRIGLYPLIDDCDPENCPMIEKDKATIIHTVPGDSIMLIAIEEPMDAFLLHSHIVRWLKEPAPPCPKCKGKRSKRLFGKWYTPLISCYNCHLREWPKPEE